MQSRVHLLGIPIDPVTAKGALARLQGFLQKEGGNHVLTPNSEMLVAAHRNPEFKSVLQGSALNLPDSAGLLLMARFTRQKLPARVTGVDTVQLLCSSLSAEHRVFLLGAGEGIAERAAEELKKCNPSLTIAGTCACNPDASIEEDICERIRASGAHILLVAYGAPQQDLWIARNLRYLPNIRLAVGVGGTFDFLAGDKKRAPSFLRRIGLEWLWRLILEPRRIGRIFTAVVVFPALVLLHGKNTPKG